LCLRPGAIEDAVLEQGDTDGIVLSEQAVRTHEKHNEDKETANSAHVRPPHGTRE
jgi:hypothetical protein